MEQLIQEAVVTVPRALIGETIDMVAVLAGRGSERRLAELARVDGLGPDGDSALTPLPCPSPVSAAPLCPVLSSGIPNSCANGQCVTVRLALGCRGSLTQKHT